MIGTKKKVMTILLALCLVASLLPTTALASGTASITSVSYSGGTLQAGKEASGSITVTVEGGTFKNEDLSSYITANVGSTGLEVAGGEYATEITATMAVSGTPTQSGSITITVSNEAFETGAPSDALTDSSLSVAAAEEPSVDAGTQLTAGTAASTVQLTVSNNTFASTSSATPNWSIEAGDMGVSLDGVEASGDTATLTLSGTPAHAGSITVTMQPAAFTYQPGSAASCTITVSAPSVTAEVSGGPLTAGTAGQITVQATGSVFTDGLTEVTKFPLSGGGVTQPDSVSVDGETATLTVTALEGGTLTVGEIPADAFKYQPASGVTPDGSVTVNAAADPTVNASGTLTAGVSNGSISLEIDGGTNTFASTLQAGWFTLKTDNGDSLTVTGTPTGGSASTTLTVAEAPTKAGQVTSITINKAAFKYQTEGDVTATGPVTINAATVTMSNPDAIVEGKDKTIALSLTAGTFADSLSTNNFTVEGCGVSLQEASRTSDQAATLTLTAPPAETGPINITAKQNAFKYQPSGDVKATVQVNPPDGTVSAALTGELYAGTEVSGQTITLTAGGDLTFKEAQKANFSLSGAGSGGLEFTASGSGTNVTLTLSGTPDNEGAITVTANKEAFTYAPTANKEASGSITVKAAPSVTLSGEGITAGDTNKITITIDEPAEAKFVTGVAANKFSVSGIDGVNSVTNVEIEGGDKTAKITLNAVPTKAGALTVTVTKDAFTPVAAGNAEASITVSAPTGSVSGKLNGTLTAGKEATGTSITLTATDTLKFKTAPDATSFTLTGPGIIGTLKVDGVQHKGDQEIQLDLSGIPAAGGTFTVTVPKTVFVAEPADEPDAVSLTVGYPNITLAADPNHIAEEDESVKSIKLKATDGAFKAVSGTSENFSFSTNITGITLTGVTADEGSTEAILTFSGTPETTGRLTIKVKKEAFQYQPQADCEAYVEIGKPTGEISATPGGSALYNGTPVTDQTVVLDITVSHGLHFKEDDLLTSDFTLTGNYTGLTIEDVTYESPTKVTLTLGGTPSVTGSFQVQANTSAFKMAPASAIAASGNITISAAPAVEVSADLSTPLYAGTSAAGATITLEIKSSNTAFAAAIKENFSLSGTYAGLSITNAALSGGKIVLTLSGTPAAKGEFQVQIKPEAFTIRPAANVNATPQLSVNGANVTVTVDRNDLQAGQEDKTFTLTVTGSSLVSYLTGKVTLTKSEPEISGVTWSAAGDGSTITVTCTGKPTIASELTFKISKDAFDPAPDDDLTVTVRIARGAQTEETAGDAKGDANLGSTLQELANAVLKPADKTLFDQGAEVKFELNIEDESTTVSSDDKSKVEAVSTSGGYTVGQYLDVTLSYTVNGGPPEEVTTTSSAIKVVFNIPESLRAAGREYAVVRVHDSTAEIIAGPVTGNTISVSTDKFSTYAIIYRAGSGSGGSGSGGTAPNTGDGTPLALWTGALALCVSGLAAVLTAKRKKHSR